MLIYADRTGNIIEMAEWFGLQHTQAYCQLRLDKINGVEISTMWIGIGNDKQPKPMIFETMTFTDDDGDWDRLARRYATEEEALAGHEAICERIRREVPPTIKEEDEI